MRLRKKGIRNGHAALEYALLVSLAIGMMWGAQCLFQEFHQAPMRALNSQFANGETQIAVSKSLPTELPVFGETVQQVTTSDVSKAWPVPMAMTAIAMVCICFSLSRQRINKRRERRGDPLADVPKEAFHDRLFDKRQDILKVINNDIYALLEGRLKVRHLMTSSPMTVKESTSVQEVRTLMTENQMRHMLVCDADGALSGVISDRDLTDAIGKVARDIMTSSTFTIDADSQVSPAATLMIDRRISMLPVIDQGKLCGVITTTDLVMALQSGLQVMLKLSVDGGTRATDNRQPNRIGK